jgi:hypothetical protein
VKIARLLCSAALAATAFAQKFTAADYARAEKFMGYNVNSLVYGTVRPNWLDDGRV